MLPTRHVTDDNNRIERNKEQAPLVSDTSGACFILLYANYLFCSVPKPRKMARFWFG